MRYIIISDSISVRNFYFIEEKNSIVSTTSNTDFFSPGQVCWYNIVLRSSIRLIEASQNLDILVKLQSKKNKELFQCIQYIVDKMNAFGNS